MNAFRLRPVTASVAQRWNQQSVRRSMSSKAFPNRDGTSFKKNWLSDPSTYPIIVIMSCGLTFMCGMSLNALLTYRQGVDISPSNRGSIMKQYSDEHRVGMLERFVTTFRGGIKTEGAGIDHEKWAKQKEEYFNSKE
eukprot:Nitzschia sp. Nitz4//scaffold211_size37880//16672//17082//NITZ4_007705-RA/size37880-processed-gene-0.11-mRNA-1//-1//CDS//3329541976//1347//frame0